jgi:hypothetical protein
MVVILYFIRTQLQGADMVVQNLRVSLEEMQEDQVVAPDIVEVLLKVVQVLQVKVMPAVVVVPEAIRILTEVEVVPAVRDKTQTLVVIKVVMEARAFCHLLQEIIMLVVVVVVDMPQLLHLLVLPAMVVVPAVVGVLLQELVVLLIQVVAVAVELLVVVVPAVAGVRELLFLNIQKYSQSQLAVD